MRVKDLAQCGAVVAFRRYIAHLALAETNDQIGVLPRKFTLRISQRDHVPDEFRLRAHRPQRHHQLEFKAAGFLCFLPDPASNFGFQFG